MRGHHGSVTHDAQTQRASLQPMGDAGRLEERRRKGSKGTTTHTPYPPFYPPVQDAYHKLAKKYHPDLNKNGEEMFKKVKKAYEEITSGEASSQERQGQGQGQGQGRNPYRRGNAGEPGGQHSARSGRHPTQDWNPYTRAGGYDPRMHRAWSQRAEYQRVQEEEERIRKKAKGELDLATRVVIAVIFAFAMFPLIGGLFSGDETERRRRYADSGKKWHKKNKYCGRKMHGP